MIASSYKFGEFELDCARYELRRNGRTLKLERIPMELLILLAEKDGNVVTRQEIVERLWGKDVFVDTEHGINTAIRKIRSALKDDPEQPRFIQTVTGKGYRFVAERQNGNHASAGLLEPVVSPAQAADLPAKSRRMWPIMVALIALCLAAGGLLLFNSGGIRARLFPSSQRQIRSIAVLPLANLSGDPSQDYFADGMTDELITMLAKNTSLRVVSRTSAMQYKNAKRPVGEIARELGVDGILEGSVEKSGNHVHMTVQLIHASRDTHVWAESYDRTLSEAFSLPSDLSQTIAKEIKTAISPVEPQHPINPDAHDAYLRGRYSWFNRDMQRSQEYFEKAIQMQPDYAAAWSGLADSYTVRAVDGTSFPSTVMGKAEEAARKAIELDDSLSDRPSPSPRAARSTPNTRPAAVAARCTAASVAPAPTRCAARRCRRHRRRQSFGGQQHVVVFGHRSRHQRRPAALHRDERARVTAHPEHRGDLVVGPRPHQRARVAPVAAGVVDAAPVEHVGIGADVAGADDRREPVGQVVGHSAGVSHEASARNAPRSIRPLRGRRQVLGQQRRPDDHGGVLGPAHGDVEPVPVEQERDSARHVVGRRGRHRHEDDRCLPALELVDGADLDVRQARGVEPAPQRHHLSVVRRDDQHVASGQAAGCPCSSVHGVPSSRRSPRRSRRPPRGCRSSCRRGRRSAPGRQASRRRGGGRR